MTPVGGSPKFAGAMTTPANQEERICAIERLLERGGEVSVDDMRWAIRKLREYERAVCEWVWSRAEACPKCEVGGESDDACLCDTFDGARRDADAKLYALFERGPCDDELEERPSAPAEEAAQST